MHAQQPTTSPATMWTAYVQELGLRLAAVAGNIHDTLNTDMKQLHGLQTIVHGDFKTANLFFSPSAGACVSLLALNDQLQTSHFFRARSDALILFQLPLFVTACCICKSIRSTITQHRLHATPTTYISLKLVENYAKSITPVLTPNREHSHAAAYGLIRD